MMNQEVLSRLPALIERLPLRQRQVVVGRYYDGRSFEEMAQALEVRPATVRSLLRHGLNNLRARFVIDERG
jgi:RNA polymerase sigma factor (sigma-70 family)